MRLNLFEQLAIAVALRIFEQVSAVANGFLDPRPSQTEAADAQSLGGARRLKARPRAGRLDDYPRQVR